MSCWFGLCTGVHKGRHASAAPVAFAPNNGLMSGFAQVLRCDVVTTPIAASELASLVAGPDVGAVVTFSGDVRRFDHGREVRALAYEGHPTAARILGEVAGDIATRFEVVALAVLHRVGDLEIGDTALAAAVAAEHRGEAFQACQALVDMTKERLPVWKHQWFTDGTDEWVNCA